jgi:Flp pilus assembly protein TadG
LEFLTFVQKIAQNFIHSTHGNIAVVFGLLLPVLLVGAGVSVDYLRAYGAYSEMQAELDLALIAAIKQIDNLDSDEIEGVIEDWFGTQTRLASYSLDDVVVDTSGSTISATAYAVVPTTLMNLAGISSVPVSVNSAVAGPATSYLNVYLVFDKSASMLLASTPGHQSHMTSALGCAFACHEPHTVWVNGKKYDTYYHYSSSNNVQLRTDVMSDAVEEVINTVEELDPSGSRIKIGLYRLATTTASSLSPTADMDAVRAALVDPTKYLTSATSVDGTYFDVALPALTPMVGTAGDGKTAQSPLKLVMMITDGVQSRRSWVINWWERGKVGPLNPEWCDGIKQIGATFATVYTTYLPIPTDWGYNATLGSTMASSVWTTTWGGDMRSGVPGSTTRRDYLPYALEDCATSSQYFMQATDVSEISASLDTLFNRYLSSVRLTR